MKDRKAVFIVAYSINKNKIEYLLLKRKLHWKGWEFPKGAINFLETKKRAVKRELREETGLNALKIKKFNFFGKYNYDRIYSDRPKFIGQTFSLYSVQVEKRRVILDKYEHSGYKWVKFPGVIKMLTWNNQKKALKLVHKELKNE